MITSPLPWKTEHRNLIYDADGHWVADVFVPTAAAQIVHTVNCHAELVAALEELEMIVGYILPTYTSALKAAGKALSNAKAPSNQTQPSH